LIIVLLFSGGDGRHPVISAYFPRDRNNIAAQHRLTTSPRFLLDKS
jgi:hypothetical protein